MIDLHSHILPELDDGSQSLQESLAMARMAVESGVTVMAATPHCTDSGAREIYIAWKLLRLALKENHIPLKLFLGMEIFGTENTLKLLREKKLFTLNGSRYPLIEFSFHSDGEQETWILRSLCKAGLRPVVAHPERYSYIQYDPEILNKWHHMGCVMQVNRGSLLGRFGVQAQDIALEMVERKFASVVASDAHSPQVRTPWMEDVQKLLSQEFSPGYSRLLLLENPARRRRKYEKKELDTTAVDRSLSRCILRLSDIRSCTYRHKAPGHPYAHRNPGTFCECTQRNSAAGCYRRR